ncbi:MULTISPECIES: hypothetical protein [unclassified Brachybacterium]|uniref:hypothetical protein n=1 Tax=unclassified Brachybacterium TaxID=2623841 RepID=UPI00361C8B8F
MMIGDGADLVGRAEREVRGIFADEGALERAVAWASEVLAKDGIDPSAQQFRAMRSLCRAERRLSLTGARYLVNATSGRGNRRAAPRNPILE